MVLNGRRVRYRKFRVNICRRSTSCNLAHADGVIVGVRHHDGMGTASPQFCDQCEVSRGRSHAGALSCLLLHSLYDLTAQMT